MSSRHVPPPSFSLGDPLRHDEAAVPERNIEPRTATDAFDVLCHAAAWAGAENKSATVQATVFEGFDLHSGLLFCFGCFGFFQAHLTQSTHRFGEVRQIRLLSTPRIDLSYP